MIRVTAERTSGGRPPDVLCWKGSSSIPVRWFALIALLVWMATTIAPMAGADPVGDDVIYDQVRMKLVSNPDVRGGAIEVTVKDGVVTLEGMVHSDKAKRKAESVTKKQKGVKEVINKLTVRQK